jgi:hypothetical protein
MAVGAARVMVRGLVAKEERRAVAAALWEAVVTAAVAVVTVCHGCAALATQRPSARAAAATLAMRESHRTRATSSRR